MGESIPINRDPILCWRPLVNIMLQEPHPTPDGDHFECIFDISYKKWTDERIAPTLEKVCSNYHQSILFEWWGAPVNIRGSRRSPRVSQFTPQIFYKYAPLSVDAFCRLRPLHPTPFVNSSLLPRQTLRSPASTSLASTTSLLLLIANPVSREHHCTTIIQFSPFRHVYRNWILSFRVLPASTYCKFSRLPLVVI